MVSPFFHLAQCASVEKRDEMIISESAPRMHARCTPAADVQGAGWTTNSSAAGSRPRPRDPELARRNPRGNLIYRLFTGVTHPSLSSRRHPVLAPPPVKRPAPAETKPRSFVIYRIEKCSLSKSQLDAIKDHEMRAPSDSYKWTRPIYPHRLNLIAACACN